MADGIPPGFLTYKFAVVCDKFRLPLPALADMTDYQIDALFFHARDKDGVLRAPEPPAKPPPEPTAESRLAGIGQLVSLGLITPADAAALREEVARGRN